MLFANFRVMLFLFLYVLLFQRRHNLPSTKKYLVMLCFPEPQRSSRLRRVRIIVALKIKIFPDSIEHYSNSNKGYLHPKKPEMSCNCFICEWCIGVLLGRASILQAKAHRVVARLVSWRSARILLATRILSGIRLVLRLRFSCFLWLCRVLTCSVGRRSMTASVCWMSLLGQLVFRMFFRIPCMGT